MTAVRVITAGERNRALLARQGLLVRYRTSLPRAVERMGGIQAQYAPSAYIGLWSRLEGFRRDDLTWALMRRSVIQGTLMRSTIHIVSRRDYWPFAAGIRRARQEWWLRIAKGRGLADLDHQAVAALIRGALTDGPATRSALIDALVEAGHGKEAWEDAGAWIEMVRVPPSGTWERRRADLYGDAVTWVGPESSNEAQGLETLLLRYLSAFGPSTPADAARWAGVPTTAMETAAERVVLRSFVDAGGGDLVDLPRAPIPDPDHPAPVRFLGTWDALLLVHARAAGVLPEDYRPLVFHTKNPQSVTPFLVDGAVAGEWRSVEGRIRLTPYHPLPRRALRELESAAGELEAFLA